MEITAFHSIPDEAMRSREERLSPVLMVPAGGERPRARCPRQGAHCVPSAASPALCAAAAGRSLTLSPGTSCGKLPRATRAGGPH